MLRIGSIETLYAEGMVYAFHRKLDDQEAIVAFNAGDQPVEIEISMPGDGWGQEIDDSWRITDKMFRGTVYSRDTLILINQ